MLDDDAIRAESSPRGVDSYYRPGNFKDPSPIVYPAVANRAVSIFKIQLNLIAILPMFKGYEEPYAHLRELFSFADTYQVNNTTKDGELVKVFYDGLEYHNQQFVMATSGGTFFSQPIEEEWEFFKMLSKGSKTQALVDRNNNHTSSANFVSNQRGTNSEISELSKKVDLLLRNLGKGVLNVSHVSYNACSMCGDLIHLINNYQGWGAPSNEEVNGVYENRPRNDPFSKSYNPGWHNHPNFRWKDDDNYNHPNNTQQQNQVNIERQMGQLAEEVHKREAGKLLSYPDRNPKHKPGGPEHVNMVTSLQNGKTYNNHIKNLSVHEFSHDVEDFVTGDEIIVEGKKADNVKSDSELVNDLLKDFPKPPTQNPKATESPKVREGGVSTTTTPYPTALEKLASARLAKKGPYSEDMWDTFKKRKLKATLPKKIELTEHVSAVLSSSLPPKFKDPRAPLISVMVGNIAIKKALLDLGASINILPASLVDKYDLGTLCKTDNIIFLADRSTKIPGGILEDVIVKVDDFYYPVDFFVMETESPYKDVQLTIILGSLDHQRPPWSYKVEPLPANFDMATKPSLEVPPTLELKPLPSNLKYAFLAGGWIIADLKGITPSLCMHRIVTDPNVKPSRDAQRRLNLNIKEVVKKEVLKWLDAGIIYPISDSKWKFYCFLDGYSGYNQIPIHPDDQYKTTFTCPYGTFAFRRMPFGLCNAAATFQRCLGQLESDDDKGKDGDGDGDGDDDDDGDDGEEGDGDDHDEDDDDEEGNDDDDDQEVEEDDEKDNEEEGGDDEQDSDEEEFIHYSLNTHAEEEPRDEKSFGHILKTPEDTDDKGNGEENLGINVGREEGHDKEEEEDELYRDVNINQGRGIQTTQEIKDSHVTLTLVNPNGQQQSSSVSSQFTPTSMAHLPMFEPSITPSTIATITTTQQAPLPPTTALSTLIQDLPNFGLLFGFDHRLETLEANFSEFSQTNQFAGASDQLCDEAQADNDEFLKTIDENMQKIIKKQVKEQVKVQVSKTLPKIEQTVNEQLKAQVLTRNLYKALVKAYESDKIILDTYKDTVMLKRRRNDDADRDEEPFAGSDRGSKRRREGNEPESVSAPTEKATRSAGKSTQRSKSRQPSHPEWFSQQQKPPTSDREVYKATTDQLDWVNPEGQQYPHNLLKPLPLIPNYRGRHVIPFDHFINNDLEYIRGGTSSRKYTTSVTKTKAADYRHIKWIKDLVPRTMWIQEPTCYDKHALWGVSHWGRKRQQFYGFAWHKYKHLDWITVRRDDDKLYKFKEGDFKRLRIQDIEYMLLLLVQGKLTNLIVEECFAFNVSLRMYTRSIVIQRRVEDLQLGNKDKQNMLMRIDELHKFSDGTLTDVRTALDDRLKGIRMKYLP
uniref:Reverse transcriptase domain-containing protein n=1 Tax=Tanacetum cinerariifolium TaxID=118510 RepID=A0A699H8E9_TANCI|nr:hypothetical protein [Tanacetum cinerariifolium]